MSSLLLPPPQDAIISDATAVAANNVDNFFIFSNWLVMFFGLRRAVRLFSA